MIVCIVYCKVYVNKMENDGFEEVPTPVKSGVRKQSSIHRIQECKSELEIIRRDVQEKDQQIRNLKKQVKKLEATSIDVKTLLIDLEAASGNTLMTPAQRSEFDQISPHDSIAMVRNGIRGLIAIHSDLGKRFEEDFTAKATDAVNEMARINDEIEEVRFQIAEKRRTNQKLARIASMAEKERESLVVISDNLKQQMQLADEQYTLQAAENRDMIAKIHRKTAEMRVASEEKEQSNNDLLMTVQAPISKTLRDNIREDIELSKEISKLQTLLERQFAEHSLVDAELNHVLVEIERAKETIEKFKVAHGKESMDRAERINRELRQKIDEQRETSEWNINYQVKKNKSLEKQKSDLEEEKAMLQQYLAVVEKKLAAQMLKLPTIASIQNRGEPPKVRVKTAKKKTREPDDLEMRGIKRAISHMQQQRRRAQTAFA